MKFYDYNGGTHHTPLTAAAANTKILINRQKANAASQPSLPHMDAIAEGARVGELILDEFVHWYPDVKITGWHNGEPMFDNDDLLEIEREAMIYACKKYPNYMVSPTMCTEIINHVSNNLMDRIADANQQGELNESESPS